MMALKQIKIREAVYKQLDSFKRDDESYSIAIQNLIDENERLKARNDELKSDKETLMKIAMKTEDSIAFPNMSHYIYFVLPQVLKDDYSDDEKMDYLKMYLRPLLDNDSDEVLRWIDDFKGEYDFYHGLIGDLESWIKNNYK